MGQLPQPLRSPLQAHPAQDLAAGGGVGQGVVVVEQKDAVVLAGLLETHAGFAVGAALLPGRNRQKVVFQRGRQASEVKRRIVRPNRVGKVGGDVGPNLFKGGCFVSLFRPDSVHPNVVVVVGIARRTHQRTVDRHHAVVEHLDQTNLADAGALVVRGFDVYGKVAHGD